MEAHTEDLLDQYIVNLLSGGMPDDLPTLEQKEKTVFQAHVHEILKQLKGAEEFYAQLAQGNLGFRAPRGNVFLNSAKDLQASLRHLLWQAERVAQGDYNNRVEFLGDFSKTFNIFIGQVALREDYQKKAALLEKSNLEQKNRILTNQLDQQLAHYNDLKRVYEKIRKTKHDLKNHFLVLDDILSRKEVEDAQEYLHSFMSDILNASGRIFDTQNPIIDALLTEKCAMATQAGIDVETDITIRPNTQISNVDWCILFGNALDNAIEACRKLTDGHKKIIIKAVSKKSLLNIVIRNTAQPPVKGPGKFYETTKEDKMNHGLGLGNIADVVAKYDGALETRYQDGFFTLTCVLCGV